MKEYIITTEKGANQQLHELTRCRDCRHRAYQFGQDHYCRIVSNIMPDDGYCSQGEKNENA